VEPSPLPEGLIGPGPEFPELSEVDVVRHYVRLSSWNFSVDHGCTRRFLHYNTAKINESRPIFGVAGAHRCCPSSCQGALSSCLKNTAESLIDAVTFNLQQGLR
jgi:glycine dehydrogenase subunit 2